MAHRTISSFSDYILNKLKTYQWFTDIKFSNKKVMEQYVKNGLDLEQWKKSNNREIGV